MRRDSREGVWSLTVGFAGAACSLVMMAVAPGCGDDFCLIINTSNATVEWVVTFAVTSSNPIRAIDLEMAVEPCSEICECHDGCGCDDRCDCSGRFASDFAELECEPLVDATYRGALDDDGRAHITLVMDESVQAPADFLTCNYLSATEPSPSDFRFVVNRTASSPAARIADPGEIVIARISPR